MERAPLPTYLESLSAAILNLINERNYRSELLENLSPAFITVWEGKTVGRTREEHVREMQAAVQQNPDVQMHTVNMSSNVDEDRGQATVWVTQRVTNFPHDALKRESIKMLVWEKRNGKRICLKHVGMRGSGMLW